MSGVKGNLFPLPNSINLQRRERDESKLIIQYHPKHTLTTGHRANLISFDSIPYLNNAKRNAKQDHNSIYIQSYCPPAAAGDVVLF